MHDVIVVGAGPGGLYTALRLAADGYDVAVLEEHEASGTPVHCTGVLAAEAYDEFELPRDAILNTLKTAHFCSPSGHIVEYTTPSLEVLVVDRPIFDLALQNRARQAGVAMLFGAKVTAVDVKADGVAVRSADGSVRNARAAVLACGASYSLQRRLNLGAPPVFLQSGQIELPTATPKQVEIHFGRSVAPKGFAWVVPIHRGTRRCARVGLMCGRHAANYLTHFLSRVSVSWGLSPGALQPRYKLLPLAPIRRTFSNRVLAVGDAAGLVKATTGGGIYYTIVSADIAAEVLSGALRRNALAADTLQKYEAEWRRRLGAELRAQQALRTLAHWLTDKDIEALFELARTDGVRPLIHRFARFNHHRELILSLFKHPPARRVLFRQLLANRFALSAQ
jgi:geranylgeranyl reductase family protein